MLILMLFAPQMNIIFAISTSNNPIINKIYAWERWRTSAWYLPNYVLYKLVPNLMFDWATQDILFIIKIKWVIQLPFIGSVLSKKSCMVTKLSPCNWLVLLSLSVLTNTIHLVEFHGEFRIQVAYRQPFLHRRTAPAWAWLSMGEQCVPIKFICSACLPSKTWRVETCSFFSRTTTTSLLTSYLWGFRGIGVARSCMNVRWVVVVVVVVLFLGNVPWVKNHVLLESRL